jgi:hypothetical protein
MEKYKILEHNVPSIIILILINKILPFLQEHNDTTSLKFYVHVHLGQCKIMKLAKIKQCANTILDIYQSM